MTKTASIKYISDLLAQPGNITDGDSGSIQLYRQSYPYFVPARYLEALEIHRSSPFDPEMISAMQPYIGNWMLFCDFLEKGLAGPVTVAAVQENRITDKKKVNEPNNNNAQPAVTESVKKMVTEQPTAQQSPEIIAKPVAAAVPAATETIKPAAPLSAVTTEKKETKEATPALSVKEAATPLTDRVANAQAATQKDEQVDAPRPTYVKVENARASELASTPQVTNPPVVTAAIKVTETVKTAPANVENIKKVTDDLPLMQPARETAAERKAASAPALGVEGVKAKAEQSADKKEEPLIAPVYTGDYFRQQGEKVPETIPLDLDKAGSKKSAEEEAKSLMVMMSFSEWLLHFKNTSTRQQEEKKEQKALKTMWQKEKLAAAIEEDEENDEIPENVFEMAVNSIAKEDGLASESLADIYIKQGKYDKAIDMYRKLSLRNPQKSTYFARKIEEVLKEKQS
jgi:hypothetical protein